MHADKARNLIKSDFLQLKPAPYDRYDIKPQSYNLSIQYNREQKKDDEKKNKKNKKNKQL